MDGYVDDVVNVGGQEGWVRVVWEDGEENLIKKSEIVKIYKRCDGDDGGVVFIKPITHGKYEENSLELHCDSKDKLIEIYEKVLRCLDN